MDLRLSVRPALYPCHPMTAPQLRGELKEVDQRRLWRLRADSNCPVPNRKSLTCTSLADWTEFDSLCLSELWP